MEDVLKYLHVSWTFIFCVVSVLLPTEGNQISKTVGSPVSLHCSKSAIDFAQLTWKMDGQTLLSYNADRALHRTTKAVALNLNISTSVLELYALIIGEAQKNHTGNYSCELTTKAGVFIQSWELIVTEKEEEKKLDVLMISVGTTVICVCFLVLIFTWIFLRTVCKKNQETGTDSRQEMQQTEDIYENCLTLERENEKHSDSKSNT